MLAEHRRKIAMASQRRDEESRPGHASRPGQASRPLEELPECRDAFSAAYAAAVGKPMLIRGEASGWRLLRHGDALGTAVALVGDEPIEALRLHYDGTGEQSSHRVERLAFAELVHRARASEGSRDHAWYLQWRGLPCPLPAADERAESPAPSPSLQAVESPSPSLQGAAALTAAVRLPRQVAAAAVSEVNAWVGCSRTSHLHFDGLDNLLVVASGAKTVTLTLALALALPRTRTRTSTLLLALTLTVSLSLPLCLTRSLALSLTLTVGAAVQPVAVYRALPAAGEGG